MADNMCDAPKKEGDGVGIAVIRIDAKGKQISCTVHAMYGFDRQDADLAADDIVDMVKERIKDYGEMRDGKRPRLGEGGRRKRED